MNKDKGCEKCDYTGFAYAKIPCVCTEAPLKEKIETKSGEISGVVAYEPGDTVYLFETAIGVARTASKSGGTVEIALKDPYDKQYGRVIELQVTTDFAKRPKIALKPDPNKGDPVYYCGAIIGYSRAVAKPQPKFVVGDAVYYGSEYLGRVVKYYDANYLDIIGELGNRMCYHVDNVSKRP